MSRRPPKRTPPAPKVVGFIHGVGIREGHPLEPTIRSRDYRLKKAPAHRAIICAFCGSPWENSKCRSCGSVQSEST